MTACREKNDRRRLSDPIRGTRAVFEYYNVAGCNSVNTASTPVLGLEIESKHLKLILQAIWFGPKLSPWCWVNGSWVVLAGIRVKTRQ
jgi:hypothetical protein